MDEPRKRQPGELLERFWEGALTDDERAELAEELRSSPEARRSYIRNVSLHFWLLERYRRLRPASGGVHGGSKSPPAPHYSSSPQKPARRLWPWSLALAATLLLAAAWGAGWFASHSPKRAVAYRPIAGVVVALHECEWGPASDIERLGQLLREGDRVALEAGLAELQLDSGSRLILHGPAALQVVSANQCDLASGEVAARMGAGADRLAISAGELNVVDQGTEFALRRVNPPHLEIEVFEGQVAVHNRLAPPQAAAAAKSLVAGQTATASAAQNGVGLALQEGVALSAPFIRSLPDAAERLQPAAALVAFDGFSRVQDGKPLAGVGAGRGWRSPWRSDTVAFATADVAVTTGRAANNGPGDAAAHRALDTLLDGQSPVYASARFCIDGVDPTCTAWVLLFQDSGEEGAGESKLMGFGISDGKFSARLASRSEELTTLPAAKWSGDFDAHAPGDEHLIVAKLEFNAAGNDERLSLWIDPPSGAEPTTPDHVVRRDTGRTVIDTAAVRFWEMDGNTRGKIDDLRIGTAWSAVVE